MTCLGVRFGSIALCVIKVDVVSKRGGESTDTQIMKLLQVCQVQYCQQCVKLWW